MSGDADNHVEGMIHMMGFVDHLPFALLRDLLGGQRRYLFLCFLTLFRF